MSWAIAVALIATFRKPLAWLLAIGACILHPEE